MKNTIKFAAVGAALFASLNVAASEPWFLNPHGVGIEVSTNKPYGLLFPNTDNPDKLPYLAYSYDTKCKADGYKTSYSTVSVNGMAVKMMSGCNSNGKEYWETQTDKGNTFVINEFLTKTRVSINGENIGAVGFKKVYNEMMRLKKGGI